MKDKLEQQASGAPRTAVLLGAGASVDAGLPVTSDLASAILDKANHGFFQPPWIKVLNAIYGAMVGYQGLKGNDPQTAVNIETLISSLRLLQVREEHEVAPFVTNWISSLSDLPVAQFERETATQLVQALRDAREKESVYHLDRINTAIAEIARAELRPALTAPLRQAEKYVLGRLTEILREHGPVDYLSPLINLARNQPGGADVITLNYDLTVESAAEGYVDLNRGFESSWNPGDELIFPVQEDTLNLIKLHGSLDWSMEQEAAPPYDLVSTRGVHLQTESSEQDESPWLVVGDRDKLATDGPTIELNYAARLALRRTDHLVIVGTAEGLVDSRVYAARATALW